MDCEFCCGEWKGLLSKEEVVDFVAHPRFCQFGEANVLWVCFERFALRYFCPPPSASPSSRHVPFPVPVLNIFALSFPSDVFLLVAQPVARVLMSVSVVSEQRRG